jgi:hypothetical protein
MHTHYTALSALVTDNEVGIPFDDPAFSHCNVTGRWATTKNLKESPAALISINAFCFNRVRNDN